MAQRTAEKRTCQKASSTQMLRQSEQEGKTKRISKLSSQSSAQRHSKIFIIINIHQRLVGTLTCEAVLQLVELDAPQHEEDGGQDGEDEHVGEVPVQGQLDHVPPEPERPGGLDQSGEDPPADGAVYHRQGDPNDHSSGGKVVLGLGYPVKRIIKNNLTTKCVSCMCLAFQNIFDSKKLRKTRENGYVRSQFYSLNF